MYITILSLLLLSLSLIGCAPPEATLKSGMPNEYTKAQKNIHLLIGSRPDEIRNALGNPKHINHIGDSTYYIYEYDKTDIIFTFIPFPFPIGAGDTYWYCLLLEFNPQGIFTHYETKYGTEGPSGYVPCRRLFRMPGTKPYPHHYEGCNGTWAEIIECAREKHERSPITQ